MTIDELKKDLEPTFWQNVYYTPFRLYHRVKDLLWRLKMAWQRAYRGYDDLALWNLNTAITEMAIPALTYMIENGHGYPLDSSPAKWTKELKIMRAGFEAYLSADAFWDDDKKVRAKAHRKFQRDQEKGFKLFAERFNNLWD